MSEMMTITEEALIQLKKLIADRNKETLGVRIGVKTRGCSGLAYHLEYVDVENPFDEVIEKEDIKLFIDPKAVMFILGTEMDFKKEKLSQGFVFNNPNEKGRCGCGESFHV